MVIVRSRLFVAHVYSPLELCEELGSQQHPAGLAQGWPPHQRDSRDHLWVNGESFAAWVKAQQKPRTHRKLEAGEGYCMHCNRITQLISPEVRHIKGKLIHIKGKCSHCGHMINRGDRYDRTTELS